MLCRAVKQHNRMKTNEEDEDSIGKFNSVEWLNLSLASSPLSIIRDAEEQSGRTPTKVFSCNYCRRKFYSSQALRGHKNGHKKERDAIRNYQSQAVMSMMTFPINNSMIRSLSVQAHSLVHKTGRHKASMVARLTEANMRYQMLWQKNHIPERIELMWPGSFQLDQPPPQPLTSNQAGLDLNLNL